MMCRLLLWLFIIMFNSTSFAEITANETESCVLAAHRIRNNFQEDTKRHEKSIKINSQLSQLSKNTTNYLKAELQSNTNWTTSLDIIMITLTNSIEATENISYSSLVQILVNLPSKSRDKMELIANLVGTKYGLVDVYELNISSVEVGKFLLKTGSKLYYKNFNDQSVLHVAAEKGYLNIIQWLISEHNMSVSITAKYIGNPLHYAGKNDHLHVVKWLIENTDIDINQVNDNGKTVLLLSYEYIDIAKYLVEEAKIDYNIRDEDNQTFLHIAAKKGNLELVKWLVEDVKMDMNAREEENFTPLHVAFEHPDIVKYLLQQGATCDSPKDLPNYTVILPIIHRKPETLKVILENCNLDINAQDYFGFTALHIGTEMVEIVKILVEIGKINVNIKHKLGNQTALHSACKEGHLESVKYLVENTDIEINAQDDDGNTALHVATMQLEVVQYLINKVDVNIKNNAGQNVLEKASSDASNNSNGINLNSDKFKAVYEWLKINVNFTAEVSPDSDEI